MADTNNTKHITEMYRESYEPLLIRNLQQSESLIKPFATILGSCRGKSRVMSTIGSTKLNRRVSRLQKITRDELNYGDRQIRPEFFDKALVISSDDEALKGDFAVKMMDLVTELSDASLRSTDEVLMGSVYDETLKDYIIKTPTSLEITAKDGSPYQGGTTGGIFGDAYTGDDGTIKKALPMQPYIIGSGLTTTWEGYTGEGSTPLDFKRTNVIPANWVESGQPTSGNLTLDKILVAITCMESRHAIRKGEKLCMAITPRQKLDMMRWEKLQNQDYGFQALRTGHVNELLGINILVSDMIPRVNVGTTADPHWVRALPMWKQSDICFGVWQDTKCRITELDQDYVDATQVLLTCAFGAGRKREESVLSIHVDEGLNE